MKTQFSTRAGLSETQQLIISYGASANIKHLLGSAPIGARNGAEGHARHGPVCFC
jgi:hypothetical protein